MKIKCTNDRYCGGYNNVFASVEDFLLMCIDVWRILPDLEKRGNKYFDEFDEETLEEIND